MLLDIVSLTKMLLYRMDKIGMYELYWWNLPCDQAIFQVVSFGNDN